MTIRENVRQGALAAAGLALAAAAPRAAGAQSVAMNGAWSAYVGCWEPITDDAAAKTRVCITPAAGASAVDVITVREGKVADRTHLEANGAERAIGRDGCTGTESARWSADRYRVYLTADITCDGVHRATSGMMSLSLTGDWIDVQGVVAGQNSGVHVARYRPLTDLTGIPAEVASLVPATNLSTSTARLAASALVGGDAVADATRALAAPVVEAWLLERGQGFRLDAKGLAALADVGVPGTTTDMMIALSYPKSFAINAGAREAERLAASARGDQVAVTGRTIPVTAYSYSPWGWGSYSDYLYGSRYGYSPYGYSPYGYGYGYGGGYYNPPVIVVHAPGQTDTPASSGRPRVVNGRGYTQGSSGSSGSSTSTDRSTRSSGSSGSSGSTGSSTSSSSGSSSSGSGSSSSSSGSGRTAHKVP